MRADAGNARAYPSALPLTWVRPASVGPPGFGSERMPAEIRHQVPCRGSADSGVNFPQCFDIAGNWALPETACLAGICGGLVLHTGAK